MSTLATASGGKATLSLGAGEVRHVTPFGRKRSIGLKRLNEALQILRLLWDAKEPVNFEGEIWTLKDAWIGAGGQQNRPEVVAMGGGPKLIEMALKYADGMGTGAPFVYADAAKYGAAQRSSGHSEPGGQVGSGGGGGGSPGFFERGLSCQRKR